MSEEQHPYQDGKRAGAHPLVVVFAILLGLWLFVALIVPSSRNKQAAGTEGPAAPVLEDPEAAPVIFKVQTSLPEINVVGIVVPPEATDSQVAGLLKQLKSERLAGTLGNHIPSTTPGHKLGEHAVADIYVFSDKQYAGPEALKTLAMGAHAPGTLLPRAIPFEVTMEEVRGHYRIDLSDTGAPDKGSLGYTDESGVHSKRYRSIF